MFYKVSKECDVFVVSQFVECKQTGSKKITQQRFSTPYYPEGNGDGDDDWDDYIGTIQNAYNSTTNTLTKYSPNKLYLVKIYNIILIHYRI